MTVLVGDHGLRGSRGENELVIALVNNMPDGAIRSTQQQFLGLLNAAGVDLTVRLRLVYIPAVPRSASAKAELLQGYEAIDDLWDSPVDAVIVTGTEPKAPTLPEEPYWPELTRLVDWAETQTHSTIWSCLAAHAAVLHLDGVGRQAFPAKLSGVFQSTKTSDHAIVANAPDHWPVPHSRQFGLCHADLVAKGYEPLTVAREAGVDIFVKQRQSLFLFFQGHLEYDAQSLYKEYLRDIERYRCGEREQFPAMPTGYFDGATAERFAAYRESSLSQRRDGRVETLAKPVPSMPIQNAWRPAAVHIYSNWLHYVISAKRQAPLRA